MSQTIRTSNLVESLQLSSPSSPVFLGKYCLFGLIAKGGMAEVYRARALGDDNRLFAIKVMREKMAQDERFISMFKNEGRIAQLLEMTNIVMTYESSDIDGLHYISMEYISGCDLTKVLRYCQKTGDRIPVPLVGHIVTQVLAALVFAHNYTDATGKNLNIVNRDVSPSNIRINFDGQTKIIDFGIAKALTKFTSEIGILKGKFSYMSPEQIRGMPIDARSDIFSTGVVLHEMLTTRKLFFGDTEFDLMERVRKAEITPPSKFNRRVNEQLDAVVLKALSRDISERYQTAQEFSDALTDALASYSFDVSEMPVFIQKMFPEEYAEEQDVINTLMAYDLDEVKAQHVSTKSSVEHNTTEQQASAVPSNQSIEDNSSTQSVRKSRLAERIGNHQNHVTAKNLDDIKQKSFWNRLRTRFFSR